jgi:hypothetical protein
MTWKKSLLVFTVGPINADAEWHVRYRPHLFAALHAVSWIVALALTFALAMDDDIKVASEVTPDSMPPPSAPDAPEPSRRLSEGAGPSPTPPSMSSPPSMPSPLFIKIMQTEPLADFLFIGYVVAIIAIVAALVSSYLQSSGNAEFVGAALFFAAPVVSAIAIGTGFAIAALSTHAGLADGDYNTAVACAAFYIVSAIQLACYTKNYRKAQDDNNDDSPLNRAWDAAVQIIVLCAASGLTFWTIGEFDSQTKIIVIVSAGISCFAAGWKFVITWVPIATCGMKPDKLNMILNVALNLSVIGSFVFVVSTWGDNDATPKLVYASTLLVAAASMPEPKNKPDSAPMYKQPSGV